MRNVAIAALLPVYILVARRPQLPLHMQLGVDVVWTGVEILCLLFIHKLYPSRVFKSLGIYLFIGSLGSALGAMWGSCFLDAGFSFQESMIYSSLLRFFVGFGLLIYLRSRSLRRQSDESFKESLLQLLSCRSLFPRKGGVLPFESPHRTFQAPSLTRGRFRSRRK